MAASSCRRPTFEQVTRCIDAETLGLRCNLDVIALRDWLLYVAKETGNVGAQDLGRSLGVKETIISDVMRDYRESCEQRYQIIIYWTERFRHEATVRNLIEAIWSENGLNDTAAAESMSRKIQESEARIKQELDEMELYARVRKESKIPILLPGRRDAFRQLNLAEYSQVRAAKRRITVQDERITVLENELQEERRKSTILEQSLEQLDSNMKTLQSQVTEIQKSVVPQLPQTTDADRSKAPSLRTKVVPKRKAPPPPVQSAENRNGLRPEQKPRLRKFRSYPESMCTSSCSSDSSLNSTSEDSERRKDNTYSYAELQRHPGKDKAFPVGVDPTHLERYLSEVEFQTVFGMSRLKFLQVPMWRQAELKKKNLLF